MTYIVKQTLRIAIAVTFDDDGLKVQYSDSVAIGCITPNGGRQEWQATAVGEEVHYVVPADQLTEAGRYRFWAILRFEMQGHEGEKYLTRAVEAQFINEGDL